MRQIGTLSDEAAARRLTALLLAQGFSAQTEHDGPRWTLWIRQEDQVAAAKAIFRQFVETPDDPRHAEALLEAQRRLQQEADRRELSRRRSSESRAPLRPPRSRRTPLTNAILTLCLAVFLLNGLGTDRDSTARRMLMFRDPHGRAAEPTDDLQERLLDIRRGQVWRLVTPSFLHGALLPMALTLLLFHFFASRIEDRLGTVQLAGLILFVALLANTAQALAPANWGPLAGGTMFGGISGVAYGLFGFVWIKSIWQPRRGLLVSEGAVGFMIILLFLALFGVLDRGLAQRPSEVANQDSIANVARLVGLLAGAGLSYGSVVWTRRRSR